MRCYMPPIVLLAWALLIAGGLSPQESLVPFLVAQVAAWAAHIQEMKLRLDRMHGRRHDR
jgi:hypothetical protein